MKQLLFLVFVFAMGCLFSPMAGLAYDPHDIAAPLEKSRMLGLALGRVTDRPAQDMLVEQIEKASVEVDNALAAAENDPTLPPEVRAKLEEFRAIWPEFRRTRKEDIIPLLLAGNRQDARRITTMVQTGRYKRMLRLLRP